MRPKKTLIIAGSLVFAAVFSAQAQQTVTDIDGNVYQTVVVGDQVWMAENLKTTRYRDGSSIPNVTGASQWANLSTGAWVYYDNNASNNTVYGKLYNWFAVANPAGLCPEGWHVPSDAEWTQLSDYLGGEPVAGGKMKATGTQYWRSPNTGATNESGFNGLPGGYRKYFGTAFYSIDDIAYFWSSSENLSEYALFRNLQYSRSDLIRHSTGHKNTGFSVRCLEGVNPSTLSLADPEAVPITTTSANVSSEVLDNGSSAVLRRGVIWGETANLSLTTNSGLKDASEAGTGAFTVYLSGLSPSTNYNARAFVINATDTAYSATVSFATLSGDEITVTDIDGNIYNTVEIGDQIWMAENLRVSKYRNGDPIPYLTEWGEIELNRDAIGWVSLSTGAWAHYNTNSEYDIVYGKLYNWHAVNDSRGLCPEGWHVPTDAEWKKLTDYLGGEAIAGGKIKEKGTDLWEEPNTGATNESGFNSLPGGLINQSGSSVFLGRNSIYWTSSADYTIRAWSRIVRYNDTDVTRFNPDKRSGYSVRCIKNKRSISLSLENIVIKSILSTSATLSSSILGTDGLKVIRNGIVWDESNDPSLINDSNIVDYQSPSPGSFSIELEKLPPSSTIQLRAFAITSNDTSYSNVTNITTLENDPNGTGTVTDVDGNVYNTVKIGNQIWMARNLRVSHYRNGDPIPNVTDNYEIGDEWIGLSSGAWAFYDNDPSNNTPYGKLYNWYAVNDSRGLCPIGWHVPTTDEWTTLSKELGGNSVAGEKLKNNFGWSDYPTYDNLDNVIYLDGNGSNESGFSAYPSGYKNNGGLYFSLGQDSHFWTSSSSVDESNHSWTRTLYSSSSSLLSSDYGNWNAGFSVRCLQDPQAQLSTSAMITTWDTRNEGESSDSQIKFPGTGTDYQIIWTSATDTTVTDTLIATDTALIQLPSPGIYTLKVSGNFTRMDFESSLGDSKKLISVDQWGDIKWSSFAGMFKGAENVEFIASDVPDLSNVKDFAYAFADVKKLNSNINEWDVSQVTSMVGTFRGASSFNQPLDQWDVSSVTNMHAMFEGATAFNQNIGNWDMSSATDISAIFRSAISFDQRVGMWNVSNVTTMKEAFRGASSFNKQIGEWDFSSIEEDGLTDFIENSGLTAYNLDNTLKLWASNPTFPEGATINAGGLQYCDASIRQAAMSAKDMTIIGDSQWSECLQDGSYKDGMVAFYPFNGNAIDSTGNGWNGTVNGAEMVSDRFGMQASAFSFTDGQNITVPGSQDLHLFPLTVSMWVSVDSSMGRRIGLLFGKYVPAAWNGYYIVVQTYEENGEDVTRVVPWYIRDTQNRVLGQYNEPTFETYIEIDRWHHFVFTIDSLGGRIYLDGEFVDYHPWTGSPGPSSSEFLWQIGGSNADIFTGKLDDIRIYDRALSSADVKALFDHEALTSSNADQQQLFNSTIRVSDANEKSITLEFGVSQMATQGFDDKLDQPAPPMPPSGVFDARFVRETEAYFKDFQPLGLNEIEWRLQFKPSTNGLPIQLHWNPDAFPEVGDISIRDVIDGMYVNKDMRSDSTVTISESFISELIIRYSKRSSMNVSYAEGWNLIGLPLDSPHETISDLIKKSVSKEPLQNPFGMRVCG